MLKIAIVGLPNAGKSTLFNRLVGRKAAVVSNIPGVTRDRREGMGRISDLEFKVIDTGGWNDQTSFSLQVIERYWQAVTNYNGYSKVILKGVLITLTMNGS